MLVNEQWCEAPYPQGRATRLGSQPLAPALLGSSAHYLFLPFTPSRIDTLATLGIRSPKGPLWPLSQLPAFVLLRGVSGRGTICPTFFPSAASALRSLPVFHVRA